MTGPVTKEILARKGYQKRGQEQAVRIGKFVGVRYDIQSPNDPLKLFNVVADPHEDHDLAADPRHQALIRQMTALLVTARNRDESAKRPYDQVPMPAVETPPQTGGLTLRTFEGQWPWLPDFRALHPAKTETAAGFIVSALNTTTPAGIEFTGFVRVPAEGEYTFSVQSDSGTDLWVHDALVVDDDYTHDGPARSGSVLLSPGWHPLRLAYRHDPAKGKPLLNVTLKAKEGEAHEIQGDALRHAETANASH
jgi:hypothetical protein